MKKLKFFIKTLLVLIIIVSCKNKVDTKETYLSSQIEKLKPKLNKCYENIIILPGSGCPGCITTAEDFFKDKAENTDYLFILTNIKSLKILNQKTGINAGKLTNVYLDYDNTFSNYEKAIYPVVIINSCNNNEVNKIYFQKPGTDAFDKI